uniref:Fibroblast growth factor binding protein 3 n=1 Tax=Capra hircus TaxID=9925 RepID=A0A452EP68_CAPHI
MSPLRWRASLSVLLLLGGCLLAAAGRKQGAAGVAAESASGSAGGSSGRFVSPERHTCSWQLLPPAPGPEAGSELALRCEGPDGARHQCAYRGEPGRCAVYAARRSHYWKQVLSGLRRKRRPCHDPAPLKARLCAGKKGRGAELRLPALLPVAGPSEQKPKGGKRKAAWDPDEERPLATGPDPDGLDENAKLTDTYCAEKWHSLCNFFVNFWNG